jgi:lipid A 3-O-deacylase
VARALLPLAALLLAAATLPACASRGWRLALQEDNDVLSSWNGSDRDYSQGGTVALTLPAVEKGSGLDALAASFPMLADKAPKHPALHLSQVMYTPDRIHLRRLQPNDRPWGGWLYVGGALTAPDMDRDPERAEDRVDTVALELGVLGPASLTERSQKVVHRIIDAPGPEGWDNQLRNEPTAQAWWERRWRPARTDLGDRWAADGIVEARARAGTVITDVRAGAYLRVGWNLPRDLGLSAIDATGIREAAGEPDRGSVHVFAGLAGSVIGRNAFLDGGLFRDSHSVERRWFTGEGRYGIAVAYGRFAVSYTQAVKSPEFREKRRWHRHGSLIFSWTEPF